jgi:hypothetical protein
MALAGDGELCDDAELSVFWWAGKMRVVVWLRSLLLLGLMIVVMGNLFCGPAIAEIRQFHETPGTLLYKSQWTLKDREDRSWQAIAFQVRPTEGQAKFKVQLRLVGFPGSIELDPSLPLRLEDRQQFLTAASQSENLPIGAVGQFDIQPILAQLNPKVPLYLTLTAEDGAIVTLKVPPFLVEEWQSLPDRF